MKKLVMVVALACASVAQAQTCERPKDASAQGVAGQSDEARLAYLSKLLDEESGRAKTWMGFWGGTYGLLTVAQLGLVPLSPGEEQPDWYWGAASTAFGLAFTLLSKPDVQDGGLIYAQKVRAAAPADTCALIAEGERMLERGAAAEASSFQWFLHAGNVLFNVGLGLILGLGYGHWRAAVVNGLVGIAVGETNIMSSPAHLISGWKRYRNGEKPPAVTFQVIPTAALGLGLVMRF